MTQYRLTALEWWQEVDLTPRCSECGTARGDEDVQRIRHREGDIVDVDGVDEARLLAAGALGPVSVDESPSAPEVSAESAIESAASAVSSAASAEAAGLVHIAQAQDALDAVHDPGELRRPPQVAAKADWVAYVVATGILTASEAEELTKLELIEIAK